ncbi:phage tail tape measure protein [Leptotrichia trevisanii]|uniref:phage tail tape measure protein n=1 Tax=Leptotrichia trevisanii TaxID=109328 RepID=UPI0026EF87E4|nr:phage tail tape measure protein [Leptotrichia trevisanii]
MANDMIINIKSTADKSGIEAVDKAVEDLTSSSKKAGKSVDELGNEVKKAGKGKSELDKVKDGLGGVGKGAKEAKKGVDILSGGFKSLMASMLPVLSVAAVVGFVKKSLDAFGEFQKGMNAIFTLLPKKSAEAEKEMGNRVRNMAKTYGIEMADATDAVYNALSAGVSEDNVFKFVETGVKASKAGMASLSDATATLNTIMNNYRNDNLDVMNVSDLLFATIKKGVTSFPELASSIGDVLPTTAAANVSFQQVAATMATLTATMGKGSTAKAGTSMRAMFEELNNSGSKTYKMFKQLNGGVDFKTFMKNGGNVSDALGMIEKKAQSTGKTVADMFTSVESKKAVNILTSNKKVFDENLEEFKNVAGVTDEAYKKMNRGWAAASGRLKAGFQDTMISFGDAIAPIAELIGTGLIGALNLVTPSIDLLGQGIDKILEPIRNLQEAWGFLNNKFENQNQAQEALKELSPEVRNLIEPLSQVKSKFDEISSAFGSAFSEALPKLQEAFGGVVDAFMSSFAEPIQEKANEVFGNLFGNFNIDDINFGEAFQSMFDGIISYIEIIKPVVEGLGTLFNSVFSIIMDVAGMVGQFVIDTLSKMGISSEELKSFFQDLGTIAGSVFGGIGKALQTAWGVVKPILEKIIGLVSDLVGWIGKISFDGISKGASALAGFLGGGNKPKKALGDNNFSGGTTTISEQGKELFATPSGMLGISPNSRAEMMLPKGTQIFSNKKTQKIINMAKNIFNNGGSDQKIVNGENKIAIEMPINIANVTQQQVEKLNKLRPIIISIVESVLSDKESERDYKWGDI